MDIECYVPLYAGWCGNTPAHKSPAMANYSEFMEEEVTPWGVLFAKPVHKDWVHWEAEKRCTSDKSFLGYTTKKAVCWDRGGAWCKKMKKKGLCKRLMPAFHSIFLCEKTCDRCKEKYRL